MTKKVVILGALSEIAEATARLYAAEKAAMVLVGRNAEALQAIANDLRARGASEVIAVAADLTRLDQERALAEWSTALGGLDVVLLAYGVLGDQRAAEADLSYAATIIQTNYSSAALWCVAAANLFEKAGAGRLLVIGSVAGDRGRQSNYLYGSTKAGLEVLVEGLAHRLAPSGASATLIKPGFVSTAMTAHIPQKGPLWSSPERIAGIIKKAEVSTPLSVYAPGYWRLIMRVIKSVPTRVMHRTKL